MDLLENLGQLENTKRAYERIIELKIATPQTILNFTAFLQRNLQYEESFRVYERALSSTATGGGFDTWPHAHELWLSYLKAIVERHADTKVERIRELFQ